MIDHEVAAVALAQVSEAQRVVAKVADEMAQLGYVEWFDRLDDVKVVLDGAHTNLSDALGLERERYSA